MGIRTPDLLNAIEALYQLSYDPKRCIPQSMTPQWREESRGIWIIRQHVFLKILPMPKM